MIHFYYDINVKIGNRLIKYASDFRIKKSPTDDQVPIIMWTNIEMLLTQQNVNVRIDQMSGSDFDRWSRSELTTV